MMAAALRRAWRCLPAHHSGRGALAASVQLSPDDVQTLSRAMAIADTGDGAARFGRRTAGPHARPAAPFELPHGDSRHEAAVAKREKKPVPSGDAPAVEINVGQTCCTPFWPEYYPIYRSWNSLPDWLPPEFRQMLMAYPCRGAPYGAPNEEITVVVRPPYPEPHDNEWVQGEIDRIERQRKPNEDLRFAGRYALHAWPAGDHTVRREAMDACLANQAASVGEKNDIEDAIHQIAVDFLYNCSQSTEYFNKNSPTGHSRDEEISRLYQIDKAARALQNALEHLGNVGGTFLTNAFDRRSGLAMDIDHGRRGSTRDTAEWEGEVYRHAYFMVEVGQGSVIEEDVPGWGRGDRPTVLSYLRKMTAIAIKEFKEQLPPVPGRHIAYLRLNGEPRLQLVLKCGRLMQERSSVDCLSDSSGGHLHKMVEGAFKYAFGNKVNIDDNHGPGEKKKQDKGANLRHYLRIAVPVLRNEWDLNIEFQDLRGGMFDSDRSRDLRKTEYQNRLSEIHKALKDRPGRNRRKSQTPGG